MIKSMTAFGSSVAKIENLTVNCELRSVNHRYCEMAFKLPERLRFAEPDLRSVLALQLKRGKIECLLSYKKSVDYDQMISINEGAVKALLKATGQIEEHMHTQQSFTAFEVLNFPGIQQETETNKNALLTGIIGLIEEALNHLVDARIREGNQLATLIEERCLLLQTLTSTAKNRLPLVLEQIRKKIKNRYLELIVEPDFDRLEQEMVFIMQKLDVAEELERLDMHVQEVLSVIKKDEPIGRRLDFLMQEMNREANTLGSKSADLEMTQISIDLKVLIEQMREQIQNIE